MCKLAGLFCILFGSVGLGVRYRGNLAEGLRQIRAMQWILERFIGEVRYGKSALSECCRQVGAQAQEPYRSAMCAVYRAMSQQDGSSFSRQWHEKMGAALSDLPLKRKEKDIFLSVADCVGLMDDQMQIRAIEQYRDMLAYEAKKREDDLEKQGRLGMGLGIMSGLLLAVILL